MTFMTLGSTTCNCCGEINIESICDNCMAFEADVRSDIASERGEDGFYSVEVFYAVATNRLGERYIHDHSSRAFDDIESLVARMNTKGVNPVDNEHWRRTENAYGSFAHSCTGDTLTRSERAAALGMHDIAEREARSEDDDANVINWA